MNLYNYLGGNSFQASFKVIPLSVYFVKTLVITYKLSGPDKYEEIISENIVKSQETGRPEELLFIYSSSPIELFDAIKTRIPCHERAFALGLIAPSL